MISGILVNILGHILFIGFILCFLGIAIYLIIDGIRKYLENINLLFIFEIVLGCVCVMTAIILALMVLGL